MLAKQFQMGEFKGNDTGSGIISKAVMEYSSIFAISEKDKPGAVYPYNFSNMPLEAVVENVSYNFSFKERVRMGQIWKRELLRQLGGSVYQSIIAVVLADPDLTLDVTPPNGNSSNADKVAKSRYFGIQRTAAFMRAIASKSEILDGGELFELCRTGSPLATFSTKLGSAFTSLGVNAAAFTVACNDFAAWVARAYSIDLQAGAPGPFWNEKKLEYELDLYADDQKRLTSENAHNGSLDWYSFEDNVTSSVSFPAMPPPTLPVVKEMLMTDNRFAGMPSSRWWEFENGQVNLGKLEGDTTDMAKIMLAQFALVYQDDWFVIPYKIPMGSYSKISGMVVTDVFGVKTYIANHAEKFDSSTGNFGYAAGSWKEWSWMDVSHKDDVVNASKPTGRMLLLPTIASKIESEPFESVTFVRDEMSNFVWAIEKTVPDFMGRGSDGQQAASGYRSRLEDLAPAQTPVPASASDAKLEYTLMNSVPENWIPFIVKHVPGSIREVQLQRASMPRVVGSLPTSLVRPRTDILSYGLTPNQIKGYRINEEEVSRAGTKIESTFQRTRWYGGKTVMWVGRRRTTGRGQGSSGLVFDEVRDREA